MCLKWHDISGLPRRITPRKSMAATSSNAQTAPHTALLPAGLAGATPILPGHDLLATSPDTHLDFSALSAGLIGDARFRGPSLSEFTDHIDTRHVLPNGGTYPRGVDTIVRRKQARNGSDAGGASGAGHDSRAGDVGVCRIGVLGWGRRNGFRRKDSLAVNFRR